MSYRDDVEALGHRVNALELDVSAAAKDLAEARRLLADAELRRKLPVLDNLHIAAPCKADWDKMTGDARSRFCAACEKNVYNLSEMTRMDAESLLIAKEGKLCVRYYQRADGTIITADCPDGLARRRRRKKLVAISFGAMTALSTFSMTYFGRSRAMMGAPPPIAMTGAIQMVEPVEPQVKLGEVVEMKGDVGPTMGEISARPERVVKMGKMHIEPKPKK